MSAQLVNARASACTQSRLCARAGHRLPGAGRLRRPSSPEGEGLPTVVTSVRTRLCVPPSLAGHLPLSPRPCPPSVLDPFLCKPLPRRALTCMGVWGSCPWQVISHVRSPTCKSPCDSTRIYTCLPTLPRVHSTHQGMEKFPRP